jgi:hypothetical protein
VLALADLKYFKAEPYGTPGLAGEEVLLSWELSPTAQGIRNFAVQRSTDAVHFAAIASLPVSRDSGLYRYTDGAANTGSALYYRLMWQHNDGSWSYSRIVAVNTGPAPADFSFRLQPNPVTSYLILTVFSAGEGNATATIASAQGQFIRSFQVFLHNGTNSIPVEVRMLAAATYFLILDKEGRRVVKPFVKRSE